MNLRKLTIAAGAALSLVAIGTVVVLAAPSVPRLLAAITPATTGAQENGGTGQSEKQDNQTGNHEEGTTGQSDKQDNQTGTGAAVKP